MVRKNRKKNIIILGALFFCTCLISLAGQGNHETLSKQYKLVDFPKNINGWIGSEARMSDEVWRWLDLDDLLSRTYKKGNKKLDVYVGYYYYAAKVGKLHSPLVCLPGQGWNIYDDNTLRIKVGIQSRFSINVRTMIAEKGGTKQLVLFWYQAYDKGLNRTFIQKLTVAYNNVLRNKGDSAFMRIIVPIDSDGVDKALSTAHEFIDVFYPEFIDFVKS